MNDLREIVEIAWVERCFVLLAIATPIVGLVVAAVYGAKSARRRKAIGLGFAIGCMGLVNLLLWRAYNHISETAGLDTTSNLLYQFLLFAGVGVAAGLVSGLLLRHNQSKDATADSQMSEVQQEPINPR